VTGWRELGTLLSARRGALGAVGLLVMAAGCSGASSAGGAGPASTTTTVPAVSVTPAPWHLSAPVSRAVVVSSGDEILVAGGLNSADESVTSVLRVDPQSGSIARIGSLGRPTHDAAGAITAGRALVFGGGSTTVLATVEGIDVASGSSRAVGSLPRARADVSAATVGPYAYVLGGYDGSAPVADVLATSDGAIFRTVTQLPEPVRYGAVTSLGPDIFVFGGETSGGERAGTPTAAIQMVDTTTGRARVVGSLPFALGHAMAATVGDQLLVMGGRTQSGALDTVYRFDPVHHRLQVVGSLPSPVTDAGAAVIGHSVYVVGGETDGGSPTSEVSVVRLG
jgi:Kelch motif